MCPGRRLRLHHAGDDGAGGLAGVDRGFALHDLIVHDGAGDGGGKLRDGGWGVGLDLHGDTSFV